MTFDLLITGGTILDGSGAPRHAGDIGIAEGGIREIGAPSLAGAKTEKTIAAEGKFVAPGFIDLTSHADKNFSLFLNPRQDYLLTQGVTTILVGNCGSSLAPLVAPEAVASLKKWGELSQVNINWSSAAELLEELGRHPLGLNVAALMGHGTIRRGILRGESRACSSDELAQMIETVRRGMSEGAFGLSTGLIYGHEAAASAEELAALTRAVAEADGLWKAHLRNEGQDLVPAMNETIQIARESKTRAAVSHLKAIGRRAWPSFRNVLEMMERAAENGLRIGFDISPYQRTGSFLYLLLPPWAREGGFGPMLERIRDAANRAAILEAIRAETIHPDRYLVANSGLPGTNGKTIAEIAQHTGQPTEETVLELLAASEGMVTIFGKTLSYRNLAMGLAHPLAAVASDGSGVAAEIAQAGTLVHPRSTGAFPHFLHRFVREEKILSWEEGIRKITALPAEILGLKDRGRISKGLRADFAIFDPEAIRDRSTYQNPYVHSVGIEAVVVNGKLAVENGQLTGTAAGQVLKKS